MVFTVGECSVLYVGKTDPFVAYRKTNGISVFLCSRVIDKENDCNITGILIKRDLE